MAAPSPSGIQVHRVPAIHGWHWLRHSFSILRTAPLPLLLLMLAIMTLINLSGLLGLAGLVLSKLLMAVLLVGYLAILRQLAPPDFPPAATTRPIAAMPVAGNRKLHQVFSTSTFFGWARHNRRALISVIQLGLLTLAIDAGAAWLSGYQSAMASLADAVHLLPADRAPDADTMRQLFMPVFRSMISMLLITIPCYLLLWYAPIFAGLHGLPLLKAVVFSAVAVGRNILAFLCHACCLLILLIGVSLIFQMINALLGGSASLPFASPIVMLSIPLVFSIITCSLWASYLDTVEVSAGRALPH